MKGAPLEPGKPSHVTCNGAGRWASTGNSVSKVAPFRSTRMSMPQSRTRCAMASMLLPRNSSKCSLDALTRWRVALWSSGPVENSVTSNAPRSWCSSICTISWLVACKWKSADR